MDASTPPKTLHEHIGRYLAQRPLLYSLIRPQEALLFQLHADRIRHEILDFGCGDGFFSMLAAGRGAVDVGLDIPGGALRQAEARAAYKRVIPYDGRKLPFPDDCFQTVMTNSVLEHVPALSQAIQEIYRVLKPGGCVLATVMTRAWNDYLVGARLLGSRYQAWMARRQRHHHLLCLDAWSSAFAAPGFHILETTGYLSRKTAQLLELFHYLSVPSLVSHALFAQWVLFPGLLTRKCFIEALARRIELPVDPAQSAALFFLLQK